MKLSLMLECTKLSAYVGLYSNSNLKLWVKYFYQFQMALLTFIVCAYTYHVDTGHNVLDYGILLLFTSYTC